MTKTTAFIVALGLLAATAAIAHPRQRYAQPRHHHARPHQHYAQPRQVYPTPLFDSGYGPPTDYNEERHGHHPGSK